MKGTREASSVAARLTRTRRVRAWRMARMTKGTRKAKFAPHQLVYAKGAAGRAMAWPIACTPPRAWAWARVGWISATRSLLDPRWPRSFSVGVGNERWGAAMAAYPPMTMTTQKTVKALMIRLVGRAFSPVFTRYMKATVAAR